MPIIVTFNNFVEAAAIIDARVSQLVQEHGEALAETARELVPVRTGALRQSIKAGPTNSGGVTGALAAGGAAAVTVSAFGNESTGKAYAAFVEFGTIRAPSQPFMTPAFEQEMPKLLRDLQDIESSLSVISGVRRVS